MGTVWMQFLHLYELWQYICFFSFVEWWHLAIFIAILNGKQKEEETWFKKQLPFSIFSHIRPLDAVFTPKFLPKSLMARLERPSEESVSSSCALSLI